MARIRGTNRNDRLKGTSARDRINALAGNDEVSAGSGDDIVDGGLGDDRLFGDSGSDTLNGGAGDDFLIGGRDGDTLIGGAGDDFMRGYGGVDTMIGGTGDDTYTVGGPADIVRERAGEGIDTVVIASSDGRHFAPISYTLGANLEDLVHASYREAALTGNELDNYIRGGGSDDVIQGMEGIDILRGRSGNDTIIDGGENGLLQGDEGDDQLIGGDANQIFMGGTGNDLIRTGTGADIIAFNSRDGVDTVAASRGSDNTISIAKSLYADLAFSKEGNDLVLAVSANDRLILQDWYADRDNRSVGTLQMILNGTADHQPGSGDPLRDELVESFNFLGLASEFDRARRADPTLTSWNLSNALLDFHLGGSDTGAIGGDLAFYYSRYYIDGMPTPRTHALPVLESARFGERAQTISDNYPIFN